MVSEGLQPACSLPASRLPNQGAAGIESANQPVCKAGVLKLNPCDELLS